MEITVVHQCAYGLKSVDKCGEGPAMKPTRFVTNNSAIVEKLSLKRNRQHRHVQPVGGRAAAAAIYPPGLIDAITDGYEIERASRAFGIEDAAKQCTWDDLHEEHDRGWRYIGDTTGETLDPRRAAKAREEEMGTFNEMKVYVYVTREQALSDPEGKLMGAHWVDVMKSSGVRGRLVAQGICVKWRKGRPFCWDSTASGDKVCAQRLGVSWQELPGRPSDHDP